MFYAKELTNLTNVWTKGHQCQISWVDANVVVAYCLYMATRARNANGRLLHFKVNPPRVAIVCCMCDRTVMRCQSDIIRPDQRHYCSPACRHIGSILYPTRCRGWHPNGTASSQS